MVNLFGTGIRDLHPFFFFSKKEKEKILKAIHDAEKTSSLEIRVHVGMNRKGSNLEQDARDLFLKLGIQKTKRRTGILIYLCTTRKEFCVIADEGVQSKVDCALWSQLTCDAENQFKGNCFAAGIEQIVKRLVAVTQKDLPRDPNDKNELIDNISYSLIS